MPLTLEGFRASGTHIRPCPFCGETSDFNVRTFDCEDREGFPTRLECETCGACGPWCYVPNADEPTFELIQFWNGCATAQG